MSDYEIKKKNIEALSYYLEENEKIGLNEWYWEPWICFLYKQIFFGQKSKIH